MDRHRTLTRCPAAQAYVLLGALRAEGLEVALRRDGLGTVYGLTYGQFATEIVVAASDYAAARAFLSAVDA